MSRDLLPHAKTQPRNAAIAIATGAVFLTIYWLRLDAVVGQFEDDAWYLILAKSLATGQGYNLINLPQHTGLYFYPPLYPFLLSLLYRASPEFPGNVFLLKAVSIGSMFILAALVFRFFHREDRLPKSLAYLLAFATAAAPSFVMLATSSLMSECLFATVQMAALLAAERAMRAPDTNASLGFSALAAVRASAAYLTRSIGITLIAALALDLLKRRLFKPLVVFALSVTLCVVPWAIYKHLRSTGDGGVGTRAVPGYSAQFWDRLASTQVKVTPRDLPARFWQTSTVIVGAGVGGMLVPSFYRSPSESGEELLDMTPVISEISGNAIGAPEGTMGVPVALKLISLCLSILVFTGFVISARRATGIMELVFLLSLVTIIVWPWPPIRFLVPLLPFLLYYLLLGVAAASQLLLRTAGKSGAADPWAASRVVLLCIVGLFLYDSAMYVVAKSKDPTSEQHPDWLRKFSATRQAGQWIHGHTSEKEAVAGDNLPMVYLYSGRDTEMCTFDECVKRQVRYYLKTQDKALPIPARLAFRSNFHGIEVLDIRDTGK